MFDPLLKSPLGPPCGGVGQFVLAENESHIYPHFNDLVVVRRSYLPCLVDISSKGPIISSLSLGIVPLLMWSLVGMAS